MQFIIEKSLYYLGKKQKQSAIIIEQTILTEEVELNQ